MTLDGLLDGLRMGAVGQRNLVCDQRVRALGRGVSGRRGAKPTPGEEKVAID